MRRLSTLLTICIVTALLASPAEATFPTVTIADFEFSPNPIDATLGGTIAWHNTGSVRHTATSDVAGLFDTGNIDMDTTDLATFVGAGVYDYHCTNHPTLMQARVRVPLQTNKTAIVLGERARLTFASGDTSGLTFDLSRRVRRGSWATITKGMAGPTKVVRPRRRGTYRFRVRTVNDNGTTRWSPAVVITVSAT